jgi:coenzyme F420-0:L-glutamate ligase / coenzyme F420-1:gamma-L-glutamate ligase
VPAIKAVALEGLPEIHFNDDLAQLIADTMPAGAPMAGDVLVLAHKAVSKAEGATRRLSAVRPSERALELGARLDKDPRHVQVVLDESREIRRAENGVLIAVTHHGFVCANAGVDASNAPDDDTLILLPRAPDSSARALRARLGELLGNSPAVLITDSFGRAWRHGQIDIAIGCAGLQPFEDWRGRHDARGRQLHATWIAIADELASAADLTRTKDGMQPAVLVSGAGRHVIDDDGPGAQALVRGPEQDLFR